MKVKICGIPTVAVAERVCALRPDAIGIYVDAEMGANSTNIDTAKKIVSIAKKFSIETFLLTCLQDAESIAELCLKIRNTHVQLATRKLEIPIEEVKKLKTILPKVQLVKVIGVTGDESKALAKKYDNSFAIDQLLLDSKVGDLPGGTGVTHDWNVSRQIVLESNKPVWLAGGIKLQTVTKAIATVNPYGVDVETGMQNPDGSKNYTTMQEFIEIVRHYKKQ